MILILFAMVVFFFLFIGTLVFVCSIILPYTREHELNAALWCAVWGPCVIAVLALAGLGLIAGGLTQERSHAPQLEHILSVVGPAYAVLGVLGCAAIASITAWFHQFLIHRMTFSLFRLYSSFVTAGIGSVWGLASGWWLSATAPGYLLPWLAAMLLLSAGFGFGGFRWARHLRGNPPRCFTWITPEEFEGTSDTSALQ